MPLVPLDIPAGVYRNGTEYEAKGRWYETNQVRWLEGRLEPIGGWTKYDSIAPALTGKARGIHAWRDNDEFRTVAIGTESNLYVSQGGSFTDISPADLVLGRPDTLIGAGYGAGAYGDANWGDARTSGDLTLNATTWSLDNWGEYLVACSTADGRLLEWQNDTASTASVISNAPTNCIGLIVSNERHLFALGADGDPRKVAFSDQEDNTTWTAAATNTAGDFLLETAGLIKTARRVGNDILIWTDTDCHLVRFVGSPFVYGVERIGTQCGVVSPNSVVVAGNTAVWLSESGFWLYDGAIRPLPCDVLLDVTKQINRDQQGKAFGGHNSQFGEMWFFYPSSGSDENDKYVFYNYRSNYWAVGELARTAWADQGAFANPIAVDPEGVVYSHEFGVTADGTTRVGDVYATSGAIELGQGDRFAVVDRIITDDYANLPSVKATIGVKNTPEGAYTDTEYTFNESDGYIDVRLTARQLRFKLEATRDADFKFGTIRMNLKQGSRR